MNFLVSICEDANTLFAAVAKIVSTTNDNNTGHVHRLTSSAQHCAGDADADDVVRERTEKVTCTGVRDGVRNGNSVGDRNAKADADDCGHTLRDMDCDVHNVGGSGGYVDRKEGSDEQTDISAVGHNADVDRYVCDDHDDVLDDDDATASDPQALEAQCAVLWEAINICNGRVAILILSPIRRTLRPALYCDCRSKSEIVYIQVNTLGGSCTGASLTLQSVNRGPTFALNCV